MATLISIITAISSRQGIKNVISSRISRSMSTETNEWFLFPRQKEGNIYNVNWSLNEDGVVPVGDAFRNARFRILFHRLGVKKSTKVMNLDGPSYEGDYTLCEAGDTITHDDFSDLLSEQRTYLSSGKDLFLEDASMGSHKSIRNGVRVVTTNPAIALIARNLLIPAPPRELDHRARFKGWNADPRWKLDPVWNGTNFDFVDNANISLPGERPVVAFVGKDTNTDVAVQFVESNEEIVGANVVVGGAAPIRALVDAMGHASTVLVNQQHEKCLALPCSSFYNKGETTIIIGANDSMIQAGAQAGSLYGAYHNVMTPSGVSAMWNGYIGPSSKVTTAVGDSIAPIVVVNDQATIPTVPFNMVHAAKRVLFLEEGANASKLTTEEAVQRIVALTDETKATAAAELLTGATCSVIGQDSDFKHLF